jgi:hypothetical protein
MGHIAIPIDSLSARLRSFATAALRAVALRRRGARRPSRSPFAGHPDPRRPLARPNCCPLSSCGGWFFVRAFPVGGR